MRLLLLSLFVGEVGMNVIDLLSSSNEEEEVQEDHTIREPVFPILTSQEVDMIVTAIGQEATEAALKRTLSARTASPARGLKGYSKTRTPRPLTKVSELVTRVIRVQPSLLLKRTALLVCDTDVQSETLS